MCWFGILAVSTPYASPERKEFVFGLAVSSIVSIISAAYGNSLEWKKKREE